MRAYRYSEDWLFYTEYTENDYIILKLQPESLPEATFSDPFRGSGKSKKVYSSLSYVLFSD